MSWWSLFKQEVDVEEITRQLAPCVWTITRHSAVAEYFEGFQGRLVGPPSTDHAQQLLDFIANRKSDEEFMRRIWQALNRKELKAILRTDSIASPGSVNQGRQNDPRFVDADEQERQRCERRKIAEWLSPLNFKASQIDHLQKREPGTGVWFINSQEFRDWRDGTPRTLWCPGSPGAGKTVLAAIIIDHLETIYKDDDDASITWIYCNYKEKAEQTICNLVGSLLKQMVQNRSSMSKNIKALYDRHQNNDTRPSRDELEQVTTLEFTTYSKVFVIIDGLDECPEDTGTQTALLQVLQTFSETVRVIVTSRDVPTIEQWFGNERKFRIEARDDDVRRYIQGRIDRKRRRYLKSLENVIVGKVADRAEGMFLFVQLLMDSIVVKVNAAGVYGILEDMPKGIDGIYADALQRIHEQDEEQAQLGKQVLKWVTFSFRPLSVEELQDALAIVWKTTSLDRNAIVDEEILMSACAGLVIVDKANGRTHRHVRLIHYTAQSYFEHTRSIHFPSAHIDIAKTCITYLSQDMLLGVQVPSYDVMKDLMAHHKFLDYAGKLWGDHVREQSDEECDEMIHQFLKDEKFLLSSQILNQSYYSKAMGFMGIHMSSFFGLEHIIEGQLLDGANPNQMDNQGRTPFACAAARGHESVVKMFIAQSNVDVNVTDKNGQTSLLKASRFGHVKVVELLLKQQNVDINLANNYDETPLMMAAQNGHVDVVELLFTQPNVDINLVDKRNLTALHHAAGRGNEEVVKLLLTQQNVDINFADDYKTPLMMAAHNGRVQVVEVLLAANADINLADKSGKTPLSHAAVRGNEKVVELLLAQQNVHINSTDKEGLTPLFMAAEYGHVKVVELLLKQPNIAVNLTNGNWATEGNHAKVVRVLSGQLDLEVPLEHGLTPLYLAIENGHWKLLAFLLAQSNVAIDDGQILLSGTSVNSQYKKLDLSLAYTLEHESRVWCVRFSADGNYLATACNGVVQTYDTKTGVKICNLVDENTAKHGADTKIWSLRFSTDGKYIATGAEDALIRVWDVAEKSIWRIFEGHDMSVLSVDFSPDGRFIVSGSRDGTACIWDMETGEHKILLINPEVGPTRALVLSVAISPDGQLIATGSSNEIICLWDAQSGELIDLLVGHDEWVMSLTFTPDGKGLVSGGGFGDCTVKRWDLSSSLRNPSPLSESYDQSDLEQSEKGSVCTTTFKGHKHFVTSVAVPQDDQWVVSGSWDGTIRFWDLHTGQAELTLRGHGNRIQSVDLSPTGGMLATGSWDGCAKLWSYTWR